MKRNLSYYDDYREIIKDLVKQQKQTFRKICLETNIHNSYFSRVMNLNSDFSLDQLYLIADSLNLNGWELEYFLILGQYQSCVNQKLKKHLKVKLSELKKNHQKIKSILKEQISELSTNDIKAYYEFPLTAEIHIYLTLEQYRQKPGLLCTKLSINPEELESELSKLHVLGIIDYDGKNIKVLKYSIHLDEENPVMNHFITTRRLETVRKLTRMKKRKSDYHFSALFSTSQEKQDEIRSLFKEFVLKAQEISKLSPQEQKNVKVLNLNFDLF